MVGSPFFFRFTSFAEDPLDFDYEEYFMRRNVGEMPNHIEFPDKEMEKNFEILFTWHLELDEELKEQHEMLVEKGILRPLPPDDSESED